MDRTDRSQRIRWTEPIGPGDTLGSNRTDAIGPVRLDPKSVGTGSTPVQSGPSLLIPAGALLPSIIFSPHQSRK
jgi:hypothetical protein